MEDVRQAEFPLAVAVCAWCRPQRGAAPRVVLSHGICPRHLQQMREKIQGLLVDQ
jgi:hypothetical protein